MPTNITASCVIGNHVVYRNGNIFFENNDTDTRGFLAAVYRHLEADYAKFYKMDNLSKLGWLATEVLIRKEFLLANYHSEEIGVILSNSNSSLDVDRRYYESAKEIASPSLFVYTLPNIMIGEICIRHGIKGENAFFISPAFDAPFMEQYVNNLINNNILQACICGWADLVGDEYKAVFLLVEKEPVHLPANDIGKRRFTVENINKIYQTDNG